MGKLYEVVIAGAGLVGLFLACELGMAGISVVALERDESPKSPWKEAPLGTRGRYMPSVDAFYRRALMDAIFAPDQARPLDLQKTPDFQFAGPFAGMMLDANKLDRALAVPFAGTGAAARTDDNRRVTRGHAG